MSLRVNSFDRALVLAHAEHVDVDRELVERVLEVHAVAVVAVDQHEPHRIEVHLVGLRGDVVLRLLQILLP